MIQLQRLTRKFLLVTLSACASKEKRQFTPLTPPTEVETAPLALASAPGVGSSIIGKQEIPVISTNIKRPYDQVEIEICPLSEAPCRFFTLEEDLFFIHELGAGNYSVRYRYCSLKNCEVENCTEWGKNLVSLKNTVKPDLKSLLDARKQINADFDQVALKLYQAADSNKLPPNTSKTIKALCPGEIAKIYKSNYYADVIRRAESKFESQWPTGLAPGVIGSLLVVGGLAIYQIGEAVIDGGKFVEQKGAASALNSQAKANEIFGFNGLRYDPKEISDWEQLLEKQISSATSSTANSPSASPKIPISQNLDITPTSLKDNQTLSINTRTNYSTLIEFERKVIEIPILELNQGQNASRTAELKVRILQGIDIPLEYRKDFLAILNQPENATSSSPNELNSKQISEILEKIKIEKQILANELIEVDNKIKAEIDTILDSKWREYREASRQVTGLISQNTDLKDPSKLSSFLANTKEWNKLSLLRVEIEDLALEKNKITPEYFLKRLNLNLDTEVAIRTMTAYSGRLINLKNPELYSYIDRSVGVKPEGGKFTSLETLTSYKKLGEAISKSWDNLYDSQDFKASKNLAEDLTKLRMTHPNSGFHSQFYEAFLDRVLPYMDVATGSEAMKKVFPRFSELYSDIKPKAFVGAQLAAAFPEGAKVEFDARLNAASNIAGADFVLKQRLEKGIGSADAAQSFFKLKENYGLQMLNSFYQLPAEVGKKSKIYGDYLRVGGGILGLVGITLVVDAFVNSSLLLTQENNDQLKTAKNISNEYLKVYRRQLTNQSLLTPYLTEVEN